MGNLENTLLDWATRNHRLKVHWTETEPTETAILGHIPGWVKKKDHITISQFARMYERAALNAPVKKNDYNVCMAFIVTMGFSYSEKFKGLVEQTGIYRPWAVDLERWQKFMKPKVMEMREELEQFPGFPPSTQHVLDVLKQLERDPDNIIRSRENRLKKYIEDFENKYSGEIGFKSVPPSSKGGKRKSGSRAKIH